MEIDQILALPIRALDKATRRVIFELPDGTRFNLVGGMDRRPPTKGVAAFSPREMILVLTSDIDDEGFWAITKIKEIFGGGIEGIERVTVGP
jgi:hypothetical protein